jgi:hypothetical protein
MNNTPGNVYIKYGSHTYFSSQKNVKFWNNFEPFLKFYLNFNSIYVWGRLGREKEEEK